MRSEIKDTAWQFWLEKTTAGGLTYQVRDTSKAVPTFMHIAEFPKQPVSWSTPTYKEIP